MADTYGVTGADIAAEIPGLFPAGFDNTTVPTATSVASFISTADAVVRLRVQQATGATASSSDETAPIAQRYIINSVLATVMRTVYVGNAPQEVAAASTPFNRLAADLLTTIDGLTREDAGADQRRAVGWRGQPSTSVQNVVVW